MKRRDIVKKLEENGFVLKRNGGNHDIYYNRETKKTVSVERHREINENVARAILKQAGLPRI